MFMSFLLIYWHPSQQFMVFLLAVSNVYGEIASFRAMAACLIPAQHGAPHVSG